MNSKGKLLPISLHESIESKKDSMKNTIQDQDSRTDLHQGILINSQYGRIKNPKIKYIMHRGNHKRGVSPNAYASI